MAASGDDILDDLSLFQNAEEAFEFLRAQGRLPDDEIELGETALALALIFMPGINPDRYRRHLYKLVDQTREEYALRLKKDEDGLALRLSVLHRVLHELNGYKGDEENYDDLQNANLIRVIERRKGLPVTLGILYLVAAEGLDWDMQGLSFPGHFLLRIEMGTERLIIDPFREGREVSAADMRQMVKTHIGPQAELSHNYYEPVTTRDVLVRLQNNLKTRLIAHEDYVQAVLVAETIAALSPDDHRILFDKGILYAKLGDNWQARSALEAYVARAPDPRDRADAEAILRQLQ